VTPKLRKRFNKFFPAAAVVLALSAAAWSQAMNSGGIMAPPANVRPPGLENVDFEQRLGQQIPLDLMFRDETGKPVRLGTYFQTKPVILSFVYYRCPMLCSELLTGLEGALKVLNFDVGKQFDVLTVSFDPRDTPELAAAKKAEILKRYKRAGADQGWHFLTGSEDSIRSLTRSAGFSYHYDPASGQFAHTTAIMVLTPEGKLARYYYGVEFPPKDVRLGLIEASQDKIGSLSDKILLYCYHYNPTTGRYGAIISRVIQLSGAVTVVGLGALLLVLFRRHPNYQPRRQASTHHYVR
jgi:protein SCO1/2